MGDRASRAGLDVLSKGYWGDQQQARLGAREGGRGHQWRKLELKGNVDLDGAFQLWRKPGFE